MVNSVLRKMVRPDTPLDVASALLTKHIGPGTNATHCSDALELIHNGRNVRVRQIANATSLLLGNSATPCEIAKEIAAALQAQPPLPNS